jgi:hypothetical protein
MTREEAERMAEEQNRIAPAGVEYVAQESPGTLLDTAPSWFVRRNSRREDQDGG